LTSVPEAVPWAAVDPNFIPQADGAQQGTFTWKRLPVGKYGLQVDGYEAPGQLTIVEGDDTRSARDLAPSPCDVTIDVAPPLDRNRITSCELRAKPDGVAALTVGKPMTPWSELETLKTGAVDLVKSEWKAQLPWGAYTVTAIGKDDEGIQRRCEQDLVVPRDKTIRLTEWAQVPVQVAVTVVSIQWKEINTPGQPPKSVPFPTRLKAPDTVVKLRREGTGGETEATFREKDKAGQEANDFVVSILPGAYRIVITDDKLRTFTSGPVDVPARWDAEFKLTCQIDTEKKTLSVK
jgi:hypothetical protein